MLATIIKETVHIAIEMKKLIYLIILICALSACKSTDMVKFEQSQPVSEKALSNFGRSIQGEYINSANPLEELVIESKLIRTSNVLDFSCLRSELKIDSSENIDINNDQELIKYLNVEGGITTIKNDSIFYRQIIVDTLFLINKDQILKRFAGNYFLNYHQSDNYWIVKKIEINNDTLLIGEIVPSDTLLRFDFVKKNERIIEDNITDNEQDSVVIEKDSNITKEERQAVYDYILNPNKKDLRAMMKSNSFNDIKRYVRK
jgi:hypothetical protein